MSDFHTEPTRIPSGECDGCEHTDCPDCGREVFRQLVQGAAQSTSCLIELALEVVYQTERYGKDIPGHAVTLGTLAKFSRMQRPLDKAWAEGVCEALTDTAHVRPKYPTVDESEAYTRGVALVAWWREGQRRQRDVIAAKANVDGWASMGLPSPITPDQFTPCTLHEKVGQLGMAYAAGSSESEEPHRKPLAGHGRASEAGPGFDSRARHRQQWRGKRTAP